MQLDIETGFNYETFFMVAARQGVGTGEPVGVFIAKRTVALDGTLAAQQQAIMESDALYRASPPLTEADHATTLDIHFESDLASFKPVLDVLVVRASSARAVFGDVRINRGGGFLPAFLLRYGWLHRVLAEDPAGSANPRKGLEGNAAGFTPDPANKYKLPAGFNNAFFNGGRVRSLAHLEPNNRVEFDSDIGGVPTRTVTIPARPTITIRLNEINQPVSAHLDTVVYDETAGRFMLTWRAVFAWNDDFFAGTLVVRN